MSIFEILLICISAILIPVVLVFIKNEKLLRISRIVLGILFMLIVIFKLISPSTSTAMDNEYAISSTISIFTGRYSSVFENRFEAFALLLLIWANFIEFGIITTSSFYNSKTLRILNIFYTPVVLLLDIAFFDKYIFAMCGNSTEFLLMKQLTLFFEVLVGVLFYLINLKYELKYELKNTTFTKELIPDLILMSIVLIIFFMPATFLKNVAGIYKGNEPKDFSWEHLMIIGIYVVLMVVSLIYLKKRDDVAKFALLGVLCVSLFNQYFYTYYTYMNPIYRWPAHICNTATILLPIAIFGKRRGLFYFTYFMNVVGALFAVLMPNDGNMFEAYVTEYWNNHMLDIIIPLMGVALGLFKRPKMKDMLHAMEIFVVYFIAVQIIGMIANKNCTPMTDVWRADYFFLYGDKMSGIDFLESFVIKIKSQYIWSFEYNGNTYYMYYVYSILFFLGFIVFSFIAWFLYDQVYLLSEDIRLLRYKTKLRKERIGNTSKEEIKRIKEMMGDKTMIKISHFSKKYGSAKDYSVKDFSLTIEDGDVFGFIGHNGAGKSTVIKSLVGIQSITEGTIEVCGYDIEKYPLQAKLNIGYVSDNHAVYEKLTGREYINYVADLYQVPKDVRDERINFYSNMFGLTDALDREAKSYSHGMKQKLVVISSLIHEPKVWVLDEPLTGLDPTSSYQIKECMKHHAEKGNIVFFSTHVIEVIEKLCTKICIISHGKLMGVYKIEDLKKEGISLEALYLKYVVSDDNKGDITEADIATTDAGLFIEKMKKEEETTN